MTTLAEQVMDEKPSESGTWVLREFVSMLSEDVARNPEHVVAGATTLARMAAPPDAAIDRWAIKESLPDIFTGEVRYAMLVRAWITEADDERMRAEYEAAYPHDGPLDE